MPMIMPEPLRSAIRSAEAVAALRAVAAKDGDRSIANPDHFARKFVTGKYALILALPSPVSRNLTEYVSPGGYCYFLARTRFMDEHLLGSLARNVEQIAILGAGYDTRAHRFQPQLAGVKVFEMDLPATQRVKLDRMRKGLLEPAPNVVYVSHDFKSGSLRTALEQAGFDCGRRTFVIWEGVSYFLHESAVRDTFSLVSSCAPGSSIAFDYALKSFVDGDDSTYGAPQVRKWLRKNGEPFYFGLGSGELDPYLGAFALAVQDDLGPDEFTERYLIGSDGRPAGKPFGHLRMALAIKSQAAGRKTQDTQ